MTLSAHKGVWGVVFCLLASLFIEAKVFGFDKKASSALSHYIMGVMYDDMGDLDKAISEYRKALKEEQEVAAIHLNLAASLIKKKDFPKAIEELQYAIKLDPEAVESHAILALLYTTQDKLDLATAEYEIALKNASKLQPNNIDIYKSLGAIYVQQKKLKEAQGIYRIITDLAPTDAQAHFYLASIYNELKDDAATEKELKKTIELDPEHPDALNFLGYLFVEKNKNLDQAEEMIKKALELNPNNGAYVDSLGWLYFKRGRFEEAKKELEKAASLLEDPVIYDHLGDAYFKFNDLGNAKLNWEKSLKLDPQQEKVQEKIKKVNK